MSGPPPPPRNRRNLPGNQSKELSSVIQNNQPNDTYSPLKISTNYSSQSQDVSSPLLSAGSGYNAVKSKSSQPSNGEPLREKDNSESFLISENIQVMSKIPKLLIHKPEITIGVDIKLRGELKFERLLRIDGSFIGKLVSSGSLIIGPRGVCRADVTHMDAVMVEGKHVGNIQCDNVTVRENGSVYGNITCKVFSAEQGSILVGIVNINPLAPLNVDSDGNLINSPTFESNGAVTVPTFSPHTPDRNLLLVGGGAADQSMKRPVPQLQAQLLQNPIQNPGSSSVTVMSSSSISDTSQVVPAEVVQPILDPVTSLSPQEVPNISPGSHAPITFNSSSNSNMAQENPKTAAGEG